MSGGFVKLYSSILSSSVWLESSDTRILWVTMLAMADGDGELSASVGGLAHIARIAKAKCEAALEVLLSPDDDSRTPEHDGRRIEKIDGGWRILNHKKYRDLRTEKQIADAERIREKRERGEYDAHGPIKEATRSIVAIEAEADAEEDANAVKRPSSTAREAVPEKTPLAGILSALAIPPEKRASWTGLLEGMVQGIGAPGMRPVSWEVLAEAATELSTATGTYSAHRYKTYVSKALERRAREAEPKTRTRYGPEDPPARKRTPYKPDDGKPRNPEKLGDLMGEFKKLRASDEKPRREA